MAEVRKFGAQDLNRRKRGRAKLFKVKPIGKSLVWQALRSRGYSEQEAQDIIDKAPK